MRLEGSATPLVKVSATHILVGVSSPQAGDALAVVSSADASSPPGPPRRVFVPSPLPCGECTYCRRALVAACPNQRLGLPIERHQQVEVPDRFVVPLDEPAWAELPAATMASAGLVAELLDATARSGLGPGDTAIWVGEEPWVSLGAAFSARRSCRTFRLPDKLPGGGTRVAAAAEGGEPIVSLDITAGGASWAAIIAAAEAATGAGHGRPERRIFVYGASPALAVAAQELAGPGSTLSFRRGAPPTLGGLDRTSVLRILIGGGYHPDLVPEALAVLARRELDVTGAVHEIPLAELGPALTAFTAGQDHRLPLVRL
jgi:threonine dehydrogenase-like Zn-dependent dehydrogenase